MTGPGEIEGNGFVIWDDMEEEEESTWWSDAELAAVLHEEDMERRRRRRPHPTWLGRTLPMEQWQNRWGERIGEWAKWLFAGILAVIVVIAILAAAIMAGSFFNQSWTAVWPVLVILLLWRIVILLQNRR